MTDKISATEQAWIGVAKMEAEYREAFPDDERDLRELALSGDWERFAESH